MHSSLIVVSTGCCATLSVISGQLRGLDVTIRHYLESSKFRKIVTNLSLNPVNAIRHSYR